MKRAFFLFLVLFSSSLFALKLPGRVTLKPSLESLDKSTQELLSNPKPYRGKCEVDFTLDGNSLDVLIETDRLVGRYLNESDIQDIVELYASEAVMKYYSKGSPYPAEHAINRAKGWIEATQSGNPWTALKFTDEQTGDFVIVFAEPDYVQEGLKGDVEISFFSPERSWGKGYAKEAVSAMIRGYIPEVLTHDFKIEGEAVRCMHLTARMNTPADIRIAVDAGMLLESSIEEVVDPNTGEHWGPRLFFIRPL